MQNKGLVRLMAVLLFLVCAFYLSFSLVTNHYAKKAQASELGESAYYESIAKDKVWFGYTLKECREKEIALGLDLKGGMNVTMEVSVPDILNALAGDKNDPSFKAALAKAKELQKNSQDDFVTLFVNAYKEVAGADASLAPIFASNIALQNEIKLSDDNAKVEAVIRKNVDSAIDNSFKVLRNRIDRFGVVQPNIQKLEQAGRILIELPGVKEPERVRKLLQGSANLEFWETYNTDEIYRYLLEMDAAAQAAKADLSEGETLAAADAADTTAVAADDAENTVAAAATDTAADKLLAEVEASETKADTTTAAAAANTILGGHLELVGAGPLVGLAHASDTAKVMKLINTYGAKYLPRDLKFAWSFKSENDDDKFSLIALKSKREGACLTGDVVTSASVDFQQTSAYASVSMKMNSEGSKNWARITKDNIHKSIAIVLDGYVYSYPTVQGEITGGNSQITGRFTVDEATDLANTLECGKMPAPARIIQEDIVGPSLGAESIKAGLISFVIAFCLILIYMIFYYGLIPGLIADTALLLNVFLIFGILCSFGSVLTLPGIAGIVLTMGMAVDANVLIFERIREEMNAGKGMKKAVEDGHKGAISAIVDSNVTSLLTGIVLAVFGTGPIKGFAVTFIIGIITTFLTAVFFAHLLLDDYVNSKNAKELPFTTNITKNWFQNTHFDFIKARKVAYICSGVVIVAGIIGLITPGLNQGIDFTGGRNYVVRYPQAVSTEAVRSAVNAEFSKYTDQPYGLNVITIGSNNQVRISTNLGINSEEDLDPVIENMIYEASKPFLAEGTTAEQFMDTQVDENVGIMSSQKVGPSIADDIQKNAFLAIGFALVIIFLYILLRFRNFAYSVGAVVALAHDSFIIIGLYALCWKFMPFSMEIDQSFIAAILTVIGYSINDTVVIFDRIREYRSLYPKRDNKENINQALNATLSRTFSTSMSTLVVLIAIFAFGGASIRGFVFALLLGVIIGTYSSLFIASPISYEIQNAQAKRKANKLAK